MNDGERWRLLAGMLMSANTKYTEVIIARDETRDVYIVTRNGIQFTNRSLDVALFVASGK